MLQDRLHYILNTNLQRDTNYLLAEYTINHMEEMGETSIYQVARDCNVSVATISRFCRKIGYENYTEFKDACVWECDARKIMTKTHPPEHALMEQGREGLPQELAEINRELLKSLKSLSKDKLQQLVKDIHSYKNVFFIGSINSVILSGHLHSELMILDKYCQVITEISESEIQIKKADSLAVVFTMHGNMVKYQPQMIEYIAEHFEKTWEISQVRKNGTLDNTLYFGKCEKSTADYMAWIYVAETILYEYKKLLEQ